MEILVSVVVPTKNRYQFLKHLIQLVYNFHLEGLELVVQDNSDNNKEIIDFLKDYEDGNISYYYCNDKLTMSENGELAIKHAKGEYVCYIGDDDGVCRNIVDCVKWMKNNNIDAAYNNNVFYTWGGIARLDNPTIGAVKHDSKAEMQKLLKIGFRLIESNMPLIYHGIVRKEVLDKIIEKYGTLFPSVPPDISGSICLASVIDHYYELRVPVIINGTSIMTGGGVAAKGGVLQLKDVGFISQKDIEEWEKNIPPIWFGGYAWANSGIKTLRFIGKSSLIKKFNIDYCLASAVNLRPKEKVLWKMGWNYSKTKFSFVINCFCKFISRCINMIRRKRSNAMIKKQQVMTISDAESFFMKQAAPFEK